MPETESYVTVPVSAAAHIARECRKNVVVIISIDHPHDKMHCTTFGVEAEDKLISARLGDFLMQQAGADLSQSEHFEDFRVVPAAEAKKKIDDLAAAVDWLLLKFQGDSGTGHTYWMQFPEYKAAYQALQAVGGPRLSAIVPPECWEE